MRRGVKVGSRAEDLGLDVLAEAAELLGDAAATRRARAAAASRDRANATGRRRMIDPTTCERDYTPAELEFLRAVDTYKRTRMRPFPTLSELLEVLVSLGYRKVEAPANG